MSIEEKKPYILCICKSNIARSQMAEWYINHLAGRPVALGAGTHFPHPFFTSQYGPYPTPLVDDVMQGLYHESIRWNESRALTPEIVQDACLVLVFCETGLCPLYLFDHGVNIVIHNLDELEQLQIEEHPTVLHLPVPDPEGKGKEALIHTFLRIQNMLDVIHHKGLFTQALCHAGDNN